MAASNPQVAPSSTLHYSRDESSTAQALSGTTTNAATRDTYTRTHSRAPSQKSAFGTIATLPRHHQHSQSYNNVRGNGSTTDDDDDSSDGDPGAYGLRGSHSGLLDGQDELDGLENEEGQHFWVNTRHLTSGNPAALSEEEQHGMYLHFHSQFHSNQSSLFTECGSWSSVLHDSPTMASPFPSQDVFRRTRTLSQPRYRSARRGQDHPLRQAGMLGGSGELAPEQGVGRDRSEWVGTVLAGHRELETVG